VKKDNVEAWNNERNSFSLKKIFLNLFEIISSLCYLFTYWDQVNRWKNENKKQNEKISFFKKGNKFIINFIKFVLFLKMNSKNSGKREIKKKLKKKVKDLFFNFKIERELTYSKKTFQIIR